VKGTNVYRTESGTIFRVSDDGDGRLSVRVLKESGWQEASIGMLGLRVAPTTVQLTQKQILRLPD
jgi:hypothetical protein